jgi:4-hydroxybenzoate polyprenyltransferase
MLADSVLLGGLYSLRLYAGGAATGIALSTWLLAFSIFIFFSLALAKRLAELHPLLLNKSTDQSGLGGRAYTLEDIPVVTALGISSGLISVLVLVLYINGPDVVELYSEPKLLLLLVPLLLYWIGRIWVNARRGELLEDPVLYAVRDFRSYLIAALALGVIAAATFLKFS